MNDECPHGMEPSWCSICLHGVPRKPARSFTAVSHAYQARYDGQCPSCNLPIRVGAQIVHTTSGVFVHDSCRDRP